MTTTITTTKIVSTDSILGTWNDLFRFTRILLDNDYNKGNQLTANIATTDANLNVRIDPITSKSRFSV